MLGHVLHGHVTNLKTTGTFCHTVILIQSSFLDAYYAEDEVEQFWKTKKYWGGGRFDS